MAPAQESEADLAWAPKTTPNACCMDPKNLTTIERDENVQVRRCACGRRHFRALTPMALGAFQLRGTPLRG